MTRDQIIRQAVINIKERKMKRYAIDNAKEAAEKFIAAADAVEDRSNSDDNFRRMMGIVGFKETAQLRRASMDLTRALAEMRKP